VEGVLNSQSQQLEDGRYFQVHELQGQVGESWVIDLRSEAFDAVLVVVDRSGNPVAANDDGGDGTNARVVITLPETGVYRIGVTSDGAGEAGSYHLSWRSASADDIALAQAEDLNQQVVELYQAGHLLDHDAT
jgi:hypothetical protein